MKKSQRIKSIVDIKATQEKKALEMLGMVQKKNLNLRTQIEGLRNYRKDYQDRFDQLGVKGVNISQLLEYRSFIDKLDQAIMGQEQLLRSFDAELMESRKTWEEKHRKTESLQKV